MSSTAGESAGERGGDSAARLGERGASVGESEGVFAGGAFPPEVAAPPKVAPPPKVASAPKVATPPKAEVLAPCSSFVAASHATSPAVETSAPAMPPHVRCRLRACVCVWLCGCVCVVCERERDGDRDGDREDTLAHVGPCHVPPRWDAFGIYLRV